MEYFRGKKVLVTGGSRGIGRCLALQLTASGADVAIVSRSQSKLEETRQELEARRSHPDQRMFAFAFDVSDERQVAEKCKLILDSLGGLDCLFNNAGISRPGTVEDLPEDSFRELIQTNYLGTVWMSKTFLPHFKRQRSGNICNIASIVGLVPVFGYSAYAASKAAVVAFSECLRQELSLANIHVTVCAPADVKTDLYDEERNWIPSATEKLADNLTALEPEQVAQKILRGTARGKAMVYTDRGSWFTHWLRRLSPAIFRNQVDRRLRSK